MGLRGCNCTSTTGKRWRLPGASPEGQTATEQTWESSPTSSRTAWSIVEESTRGASSGAPAGACIRNLTIWGQNVERRSQRSKRRVLKGWKEIAEFLGSDPMLWRNAGRTRGCPYTREGRFVNASPEELTAWVGTERGQKGADSYC